MIFPKHNNIFFYYYHSLQLSPQQQTHNDMKNYLLAGEAEILREKKLPAREIS